jgi:hypothetical protein
VDLHLSERRALVTGSTPGIGAAIARQLASEGVAVAVARHLGVSPLSRDQVGLRAAGWTAETPLWYDILREAAILGSGDRLGPVGGRIVAEVIITLVDRDPGSVRFAGSSWEPRRTLIDLFMARATTSVV